jgi:hypothetical protein
MFSDAALELYNSELAAIEQRLIKASSNIVFSGLGRSRPLEPTDADLAALEKALGYTFVNPDLRQYGWGSIRAAYACSIVLNDVLMSGTVLLACRSAPTYVSICCFLLQAFGSAAQIRGN